MDVKIITKIDSLKALTAKYPQASENAQVSRITEALLLLEREIKLLVPVGAGPIHFRDTIFQKVETSGQSVAGILGSPAEYGMALEMGTKPHFPPIGPIKFWVEKKLGLEGKAANAVAHAIVQKIGKRGTYATPSFQYGFDRNEAAVINILNQIPTDIVKAVS
jgi:hypothetical protein